MARDPFTDPPTFRRFKTIERRHFQHMLDTETPEQRAARHARCDARPLPTAFLCPTCNTPTPNPHAAQTHCNYGLTPHAHA